MYKLYCAIQRLDGFVSADAPYEGGSLITPEITFKGRKLLINIDTFATGEAKIEIIEPITHKVLAISQMIRGNFTDKQIDLAL